MLIALQLVALFQGLFLLAALVSKRQSYKKPALWLLIGAIVSVLFFILGDDDNNLFSKNIDWFFFDNSLFITFLFLFVKYYVSEKSTFEKKDLLYFIPNVLYFANEISEVLNTSLNEWIVLEVFELFIEISFLIYLILTISLLFKSHKQGWMLYAVIPLGVLMSTSIVNEILGWFSFSEIALFSDTAFTTYSLIIVAFMFYFISMKLMISPNEVLLASEGNKYKTSGLNENLIEKYKQQILSFMEDENGFSDSNLSLSLMSQKLDIPKQYISEILNMHLQTNFQDFVNGYRIAAFEKCLQEEQYEHLTLLGIAQEVGFNSKSNFYATFKKHRGLTPSEYRKNLSL